MLEIRIGNQYKMRFEGRRSDGTWHVEPHFLTLEITGERGLVWDWAVLPGQYNPMNISTTIEGCTVKEHAQSVFYPLSADIFDHWYERGVAVDHSQTRPTAIQSTPDKLTKVE